MIGVGVVIAQHVETALAGVLFHPQLVQRIDQETVLVRFPARVVQGRSSWARAGSWRKLVSGTTSVTSFASPSAFPNNTPQHSLG